MNSKSHKFRKSAEFLAAICSGVLMSMPALAQTPVPVTPQPSSPSGKVNPCPRIFYEEPHNSRVVVPQGCPPNALTQQLQSQGTLPYTSNSGASSQNQTGVGGETTSSSLNPNPGILNEAPYNRSQQNTQIDGSSTYSTPQQTPDNGSQGNNQIDNSGSYSTPNNRNSVRQNNQINNSGTYSTTPNNTNRSQQDNQIDNSNNSSSYDNSGSYSTPNNRNSAQQNTQTDNSTSTYTTPQGVPSQSNSVTSPSQSPVATVALLDNGNVNIRLVNDTGANITYQVVGDTDQRSLGGQSDVILQSLRAPITVTFQRADGGLISVNAQASETGLLEVRLDETTDVAQDKKAMRIQSNGSVFVN
ncbi:MULTISPECIES: hypothetical protein [Calothrix]|uniref:Uncharacterized protein n=2 Tax=Calothrix TaxID=1186 RepID=A0ABR8AFT0_9CYAN|nr:MULTISPECIES: hypothetical protein [Calothrix]MBD2198891.1 hypothetical protein [Calothrix parietina FACHB-288]MBD2227252.1 hypothetical protein [Calothrix anomala FACHB-343]